MRRLPVFLFHFPVKTHARARARARVRPKARSGGLRNASSYQFNSSDSAALIYRPPPVPVGASPACQNKRDAAFRALPALPICSTRLMFSQRRQEALTAAPVGGQLGAGERLAALCSAPPPQKGREVSAAGDVTCASCPSRVHSCFPAHCLATSIECRTALVCTVSAAHSGGPSWDVFQQNPCLVIFT